MTWLIPTCLFQVFYMIYLAKQQTQLENFFCLIFVDRICQLMIIQTNYHDQVVQRQRQHLTTKTGEGKVRPYPAPIAQTRFQTIFILCLVKRGGK